MRALSPDEKSSIFAFLKAIGESQSVTALPDMAEDVSECGIFLVFPKETGKAYTRYRDFDAVVKDSLGRKVSLSLRLRYADSTALISEFEIVSDDKLCEVRFPLDMDNIEVY